MAELILVINPGSTSTKVAIYDGEKELNTHTIAHPAEALKDFGDIYEQMNFRKQAVLKYLKSQNVELGDLAAIAARGGAVGPIDSGAYLIDEAFIEASRNSAAPHPANLTPIIAYDLVEKAGTGIKAYVYDAVSGCGKTDPIFNLSGIPEIKREFFTHVLNSRAVCIEQAKRDGVRLEDTTYIACHLGGGATANLIKGGKICDFVGDDEGAFSPERSGGLSCRELVKLCFTSGMSEKEIQRRLKGQGGLMAYLGVNDLRNAEKMMKTNPFAKTVIDAMIMQLSKDIGSMAPVAEGKVDKVILTGGMAYSKYLTGEIESRVKFIAPVEIMAGTFEMEALAKGIHRVITGQEEAHIY